MRKLNKGQEGEYAALVDKLNKAKGRLETEIEEANDKLREILADVQEKIEQYNEAACASNYFTETIAREAIDFRNTQSEQWHESDAGFEYDDWRETWEYQGIEELESIAIELDVKIPKEHREFENLPMAPGTV